MQPPPKGIEDKLTSDELEAFYDYSSSRAIGILLVAIVENHLTELLKVVMKQDLVPITELFNPSGPLGPFATKIKLAYLLRLIPQTTMDDLLIVAKIRNKFAHDLSVKDFEGQQITAWVKNMNTYSTLKALQETHKPTEHHENLVERTLASILRLETTEDYFRLCLRLLIHHIIDMEQEMKATGAFLLPFQPLSSPEKSS